MIILSVIFAILFVKKISNVVVDSILEPLHAIEDVAKELTEGNLHSTLEYRSEDEIGKLAHSMRKSIRRLSTVRNPAHCPSFSDKSNLHS